MQYAFNLFSHTTKIGENGYNEEEMKMVKETRKIWGVRVPLHFLPCTQLSSACSPRQLELAPFFYPCFADDEQYTHQLQT
jgi:hypothetical protein